MTPTKKCSFCGEGGATYAERFYVCDSIECDMQLSAALRDNDEDAREAAFEDDFDRYR